MKSRASVGMVLSIGAVLLFAIWPNILPLQQHLAMAQIVPGIAPANTTAAGAPDAGDPAGEEAVPHWYGGAPCSDNSCHD